MCPGSVFYQKVNMSFLWVPNTFLEFWVGLIFIFWVWVEHFFIFWVWVGEKIIFWVVSWRKKLFSELTLSLFLVPWVQMNYLLSCWVKKLFIFWVGTHNESFFCVNRGSQGLEYCWIFLCAARNYQLSPYLLDICNKALFSFSEKD